MELLTIIVYQSFQWTSLYKSRTLNYKWEITLTQIITLKLSNPYRTCPSLTLGLPLKTFVRFGGAKLQLLFLTRKYFFIFFKNIFFSFLKLLSTHAPSALTSQITYSKNGTAKILTLYRSNKLFLENSTYFSFLAERQGVPLSERARKRSKYFQLFFL